MLEAVDFILGERPEAMAAVSIDLNENADKLRNKLADAIKKLKSDEGTLILTDMFGGTPSNLSYSFLEEGRIEVVSGVNLPILMRAASARKNQSLTELGGQHRSLWKKKHLDGQWHIKRKQTRVIVHAFHRPNRLTSTLGATL